MLTVFLIAASTLVSEDLACVATGVLISQHQLSLRDGLLGCTLGIFFGDLLLVAAGRYATLLRIKPPRILNVLNQRPASLLVWTRFTPGLRMPTYLGAGLLRLPLRIVIPPLAAGSVLWTPLLVGLAAAFGTAFVASALRAVEVLVAGCLLWRLLRSYERRRKILGHLHRLFRWEFWPSWAAYLPLLPYLLWLGVKHRSFTVFTAANPGIRTGGLIGESKSAILTALFEEEQFAVRFEAIDSSSHSHESVRAFMSRHNLSFPIVLKPDVGERGSGVVIARSSEQVQRYFGRASGIVIAQEYVAGEEFGVFYIRKPGEAMGRITSITHKCFPSVAGDGVRTLDRLILDDPRAFILRDAYQAELKRPLADVPHSGESVRLVEIGSHCRGAIFLNAYDLKTPALERAIDRAAKAHRGFHFGRFDIRAESIHALRKGRFKILEMNGVGAEPTHIYDPSVGLLDAYRTLATNWRVAFEIGAANRQTGAVAPSSILEVLTNWRAAQTRPSTGN